MKKASNCAVVFVTAPKIKIARQLAAKALQKRLVACANLIPSVESHYWWQGKLERGREILILFKTTRHRLGPLEKLILSEHPYDTPEFLVLQPSWGADRYLQWIASCCK
jgi:periplasmic divalent cation tolerance protein